jgi:hypothetical protein
MAEPILNAPRIVARIRQHAAAGVAQHVGVHRKGEAGVGRLTGVEGERPVPAPGDNEKEVRAWVGKSAAWWLPG